MRYLASTVILVAAVGFVAPASRGLDSSPRPQRTIVFSSYRVTEGDPSPESVADLFLLRGTKVARRLTRSALWEDDAEWSPNGQRLAFSKGDPFCHANSCVEGPLTGSIWVRNLTAPRARRISGGEDESCLDRSPSWSEDGGTIAFARVYCEEGANGIYTVGANGSGENLVIGGEMAALDWAPSGEVVAFVRENGGAGLVDVSTDEVTPLRFPTIPRGRKDVAWSPDGRTLAFATGTGIYVGKSGGGRAQRIVRAALADGVSWSPGGTQLAFSAVRGGRGHWPDLFAVRVNGRGLRQLTTNPGPDFDPAWRP